MELRARLFPLGKGTELVLASLLPPEALVFKSGRCPVDVENPVLRRVLEAGDGAGGFWVAGEAVFSAADLRTITHFELVCRRVIAETRADFEHNNATRERTPLFSAGGESPIRLLTGLFLSRINLKPNMVGSVGDWTEEYVIGSAVAKTMRDARFTGLSLLPIADSRTGAAHPEFWQMFSDAVLGPAVIDSSVERLRSTVPSEDGQLRHLGCLTFAPATLANRPDFNRTAEPWAGWHGWPSWVVSAGVARAFKASKLRGWHFRPVLTSTSDLYRTYLTKWNSLREAVGATTRSSMDGGRW